MEATMPFLNIALGVIEIDKLSKDKQTSALKSQGMMKPDFLFHLSML